MPNIKPTFSRNVHLDKYGHTEVAVQDQNTESIDFYLCNNLASTNPSAEIKIDDTTISVDSVVGAVVGNCINITEDARLFQSVISTVGVDTISFASPCDYNFSTSASVCFGEWNLATADGSVTPVEFTMCPPDGVSYDIYDITVTMEDNTQMYESKFAGIDTLDNGIVGRTVDGVTKNLFLITNNGGFREQGFSTAYPDKVPTGTYAFWADKNYVTKNGVSIRLNGDTSDKIEVIVQDDLTDISKVVVTIHGHIVEN